MIFQQDSRVNDTGFGISYAKFHLVTHCPPLCARIGAPPALRRRRPRQLPGYRAASLRIVGAGERQAHGQFLADDVQRQRHAGFTLRPALEKSLAHEAALGAQRQGLEHVLAGAHAAVEQHLAAPGTAFTTSGSAEIVERAPSS